MTRAIIGDAPKRREDERFLTGRGSYLDDFVFPGVLRAVLVRSPHAHARIRGIDAVAARAMPGVHAVLTSAEVDRDGLNPLRPTAEANVKTGEPFAFGTQPLLASGKVRYVGEPVALVIAETLAQALDAADVMEIDYEPLAPVVTIGEARGHGAPLVTDEVPGNLCFDWQYGDDAAVQAAFASAAHVVSLNLDNHRVITNPMEPRGGVGLYDPASGRYTLHASTQNVHAIRDFTARALGLTASAVRFIAPDVGGNFGAKNFTYVEYPLLLWAAKLTGRPVKWIATRCEVFLADHKARDQQAQATLGLDGQGRILALRVVSEANAGAYMMSTGGVQTYQYSHLPGTVYRIPAISLRMAGVLTNTVPVGVTRAPGFAEAVNIMERLIDAAARQTGIDRISLRRINLVPSSEMPMKNAFGEIVDSGTFPETFERALQEADVAGFPERRRATEAKGYLRGLGLAYHIKGTGGSPHENAEIRFETDGTVSVIVGTHSVGQGHATTFPQIVASRLGIDNDLVRFRQADTDLIAIGGGSGSSRSTFMGGTAIWRAADGVIEKGIAVAASMLDVPEGAVQFKDGYFVVQGTNRAVELTEVAARARELAQPLDTYYRWTREWLTFPNGTHVVEVEIDPETGKVTLDRYTAVDDYGVLVNPMVVAGQVHGAVAQGVGQALSEKAIYDPGTGQPMTGSFLDYGLPRADELPRIALAFNNSRCTTNPLGVKGCGEAGAVAAYPAIANAIADGLSPWGDVTLDGPATPERIWRLLRSLGR